MIAGSIKARVLAVATLPLALVVACIVFVFFYGRIGDLDEAHTQRSKLLSRQVALASELGVFSGDVATLQSIVNRVKREVDVVSVSVFDTSGVLLASAGVRQLAGAQAASVIDEFQEPVIASKLPLDDLYATPSTGLQPSAQVLGYVVLEVSRQSLNALEQRTLMLALLIGATGILVGAWLANRMGRGVVNPVERVSHMVERIGHGDFSKGEVVGPRDPLYNLQVALDQMAVRLAWGRDELEQRVDQVTQELRVKKDEAESATRAKSRFLASASHDLRQPTHALGLFVTRLRQLDMSQDARHVVNSLESSVLAMQDLLDGLLDLSRLDAGSVSTSIAPLAIDDILREVCDVLAPLAAERGLALRTHFGALWGLSDAMLLKRIVLNLGLNAVRYTERGHILLASRPCAGGKGVRVEVWDSGIGIEKEHYDEIFTEYFQVGNHARNRRQGMGLGLSIVKRTAELLGHQVNVKSEFGHGTRFSVTLPRVAPADTSQVLQAVATGISEQNIVGMQVLVLEDDPMALEAVASLLQSWGCVVAVATNAKQACKMIVGGVTPDVLVSDYRLEGELNGIEAIEMLRMAAGRTLPACLMSGDTDAELMQKTRDLGLTLLHKPVRPAKLRSLLRSLKD